MTGYLLAAACILLLCLACSRLSGKYGIPMLLVFIVLGMLFGSDGLFKIHFDNYAFAEKICSVSLIFIMFYGGFGTNGRRAKPVMAKAVLLSSAGVVLTAGFVGLFCRWALGFGWMESFLIGSVISSTDAASVFAILRSKRLNLRYGTASLLEVESGSNDPCAYMLTVIMLSLMQGEFNGWRMVGMIAAQVVFGVLVGVGVAVLAALVLAKTRFATDGFDSIFVFAVAVCSYALAALLGGNGYLSAYITGLILGNRPLPHKKTLVHFFDGITGLMQILIFFLLGLLAFPSQLPQILLPALGIALFLTFAARPLATGLLLTPFKCPLRQQLLVSWAGLRGAASIVFAIMVTVSPVSTGNDVFHIVFFIVLFSILLQGSLLPAAARKLDMIDADGNDVMKTFSDYSDEVRVHFIKLDITPQHPWADKKLREIQLLPDVLVVMLLRGEQHIVPKGNTTVLPGDTAVLSGMQLDSENIGRLSEVTIDEDNEWRDKALHEIKLGDDCMVMLVRRGARVVIPTGKTVIKKNDVLILNRLP